MGLYGNEALKGLEGLGIVNEVRIYQDDKLKITIDGDGISNRNFGKDPYFKYITNSGQKVRISFTGEEPKYIIHNNEKYKLSSKEKKELNEIMDKMSIGSFKNMTVWEAIKTATIKVSNNLDDNDKEKINNFKKPNFSNIK